MMEKILTIAIPTWNRSALLNDLLEGLSANLAETGASAHIQILVSNNASSDDTDAVVKKHLKQHDFITYHVNDKNIGAKSNVLKSMELATTPYVMFIGDDDRISANGLIEAIQILKSNPDTGILLDTCRSKHHASAEMQIFDQADFLRLFFYYMGNAGFFISRTDFFKDQLKKHGYDFFNECWPQTQIMILGISSRNHLKTLACRLNIPQQSLHDEVMIYSSYYLWRTTVYDLMYSLLDIKGLIGPNLYKAALLNFNLTSKQNFFNILQCGLWVDDAPQRRKTAIHIYNNSGIFKGTVKFIYLTAALILFLPVRISRFLSDAFILMIRGRDGLNKKNHFVRRELLKRLEKNKSSVVRALEFEK